MLTAKEAKQLYDDSGAEVENLLTYKIEPEVKKSAMSGKRKVEILISTVGPYEYVDQKITPLQKAAIAKLKQLGYTAMIEIYGEAYVPRGLATDDGNGPKHTNYGFIIGW